ncbi:MAG TPA: hypothetical protein VGM90_19445 [Kofleriaceae bacterium]|jgi:hypothetical protein
MQRDSIPALEPTGISPLWLMGVGILLVFSGVIIVALRMGPTLEPADYGWGPHIAVVGIVAILRGMFRTR